jgi:hypothetical protein
MLSPVPSEMIGKYDIVHVKLLVFVVKGDPVPLLENLLKMLSKYSFSMFPPAC